MSDIFTQYLFAQINKSTAHLITSGYEDFKEFKGCST